MPRPLANRLDILDRTDDPKAHREHSRARSGDFGT
jgi:hypothetical protein